MAEEIKQLKPDKDALVILKEIAYQNTLIIKVLCEPYIIILEGKNEKEK